VAGLAPRARPDSLQRHKVRSAPPRTLLSRGVERNSSSCLTFAATRKCVRSPLVGCEDVKLHVRMTHGRFNHAVSRVAGQ
jgi:hypothetical protein